MATATVNKAFNTISRRLKPGMQVSETDISPPLDWEDLQKREFITLDEAPTPVPTEGAAG